jgi:hypothetical protein
MVLLGSTGGTFTGPTILTTDSGVSAVAVRRRRRRAAGQRRQRRDIQSGFPGGHKVVRGAWSRVTLAPSRSNAA